MLTDERAATCGLECFGAKEEKQETEERFSYRKCECVGLLLCQDAEQEEKQQPARFLRRKL